MSNSLRSSAALLLLSLVLSGSAKMLDVAVCISGTPRNQGQRLRLGRSRWAFPPGDEASFNSFAREVEQGNLTIADTVHRFVYPALGNFDVLMFVPTRTGGALGRERAERACSHFAPRDKRNRIFCAGGPDVFLNATDLDITAEDYAWLNAMCWWPLGKILQQLWGYSLCNTMIRNIEQERSVRYRWVLRMRADLAFYAPFPAMDFGVAAHDTIVGNGDMLQLGTAEAMHVYLDQLWDMRLMMRALRRHRSKGFVLEGFAQSWIEDIFGGRQLLWRNDTTSFTHFCTPYRLEHERWSGPYRYPTTAGFAHRRHNMHWHPPKFRRPTAARLLAASRSQIQPQRVRLHCHYCHMTVGAVGT